MKTEDRTFFLENKKLITVLFIAQIEFPHKKEKQLLLKIGTFWQEIHLELQFSFVDSTGDKGKDGMHFATRFFIGQ